MKNFQVALSQQLKMLLNLLVKILLRENSFRIQLDPPYLRLQTTVIN